MPKAKKTDDVAVDTVEVVETVVPEETEMKPTETWVPPSVQHEIAISTTPWIEVWRNEMFSVQVNNDGHVVLQRNDGNGEVLLGVLDLDVSSLTETMLHLHAKRVAALSLSTIKIR